jgi:hypothetical protein
VKKNKNADGTTTYLVPLAVRKLVSIDKVTMIKPHLAQVDYTWEWDANRLGREFEASGSLVQTFSTWDRATLIKSYGVDFYSAAPAKASVTLLEGDNGTWKRIRNKFTLSFCFVVEEGDFPSFTFAASDLSVMKEVQPQQTYR